MKRNALVAQSGGPSPVINSSLQGVIEGCRAFPDRIGTLYAAWHGIEGVLLEELVDLTRQPREESLPPGHDTGRRGRSGPAGTS